MQLLFSASSNVTLQTGNCSCIHPGARWRSMTVFHGMLGPLRFQSLLTAKKTTNLQVYVPTENLSLRYQH